MFSFLAHYTYRLQFLDANIYVLVKSYCSTAQDN
jgi:hypothetical protein